MRFKEVALSSASPEAKIAGLAVLLDKELLRLSEVVLNTKKLQGPQGEQGLQGPKGEQGDRGFDGANGKDGSNGKDGKDGEAGKQGVGVQDAKIDFDGSLVITLTDGTEINAGDVVPMDAAEKIRVIGNGGGTSQYVLDAIEAINAVIDTYGTIATQDADAVAITGGSINGTTIGGTTPASGTFTTLTAQNERLNGTGSNLLSWSSDWTQSVSDFAVTVTLASGTAPDSTNTANKFVGTNSTALHARTKSFSTTANVTSVFSIYLKKLDKQYIQLGLDDGYSNGAHVNIDLDAVAAVSAPVTRGSATGYSVSVTSLPSGWMRVALIGNPASSASTLRVAVVQIDSSGAGWTASSVGNGTSGYYIWGAQLEINSIVSAYVPTTSSVLYGTPTLSFSGVAGIGLQSDGSLYETSAGTGNVRFYTNNIAQEQMRVTHTASAVNYVQVTGAATGNRPAISAQGSDNPISFDVNAKGSAGVVNIGNGGTYPFFKVQGVSGQTVVNYFTAIGTQTTVSPSLVATGTDTNISQVFQSKGTGAIDLAAGSSGVNISNGGTVTAITGTASGSSYTSIPTVAITAPTTAGGVQATATVAMAVSTFSITSGGTGYTVGNTITGVGGTFTTAWSFVVSSVSGGVITGITVNNAGTYTVLPSGAQSVTGGTGSGATITISTWQTRTGGYTITNAGSGYVEQPTVSFSGGGGSGAAAYAKVGGDVAIKGLGTNINFQTPQGSNALQIKDSGVAAPVFLSLQSSSSNAQIYTSGGTGGNAGNQWFTLGTGAHQFGTNTSAVQMQVAHTASAVNYVQVTGAATGSGPTVSAQGSNSDIDFNISPKGTNGRVRFGTYTANMALTVQGYIEIKDSGGTVRKLAVIA